VTPIAVDALLRARESEARVSWRALLAWFALGGLVYGAAMGSLGARPLQMLFSALKVPLLFGVTTALCLPSWFVLNTVLGLRGDFAHALRAVLSAQAAVAVTLGSLAPLVLVHYAGSSDYALAIVVNGGLFALGTLGGQIVLGKHYAELVRRDARHRHARRAWFVLYTFVAIQCAWMLRPFVGDPRLATSFFRPEPWDNAYVIVARAVASLAGGYER
jgi:hypothetical protein